MSLTSRPLLFLALSLACAPAPAPATPASESPSAPGTSANDTQPSHAAPEAHEHGEHGEHGEHPHDGQPHAGHHGGGDHGFHKDFSDAKAFSESFDNPERDSWQQPEAVLDLMKITPAATVADLGAGTGYFEPHLSKRVGPDGKVLALDVEPKMIEFLQRRAKQQSLTNVEPRLVQPDDPQLAPASVDRILIVNTWHHIDERSDYARKLAAALAPQGEIWIVDFTLESPSGPPPEYRISAAQVVRELERGGLHAQVIEPEPLPRQYVVRGQR